MNEIKTSKWKIVITEIGQISMEIEHTQSKKIVFKFVIEYSEREYICCCYCCFV